MCSFKLETTQAANTIQHCPKSHTAQQGSCRQHHAVRTAFLARVTAVYRCFSSSHSSLCCDSSNGCGKEGRTAQRANQHQPVYAQNNSISGISPGGAAAAAAARTVTANCSASHRWSSPARPGARPRGPAQRETPAGSGSRWNFELGNGARAWLHHVIGCGSAIASAPSACVTSIWQLCLAARQPAPSRHSRLRAASQRAASGRPPSSQAPPPRQGTASSGGAVLGLPTKLNWTAEHCLGSPRVKPAGLICMIAGS